MWCDRISVLGRFQDGASADGGYVKMTEIVITCYLVVRGDT